MVHKENRNPKKDAVWITFICRWFSSSLWTSGTRTSEFRFAQFFFFFSKPTIIICPKGVNNPWAADLIADTNTSSTSSTTNNSPKSSFTKKKFCFHFLAFLHFLASRSSAALSSAADQYAQSPADPKKISKKKSTTRASDETIKEKSNANNNTTVNYFKMWIFF